MTQNSRQPKPSEESEFERLKAELLVKSDELDKKAQSLRSQLVDAMRERKDRIHHYQERLAKVDRTLSNIEKTPCTLKRGAPWLPRNWPCSISSFYYREALQICEEAQQLIQALKVSVPGPESLKRLSREGDALLAKLGKKLFYVKRFPERMADHPMIGEMLPQKGASEPLAFSKASSRRN